MKIAIMQPYFFPYLGYFQLIEAVDRFVIYDDVNFIKGGWVNRNKILVNGQANTINVELLGASSNKNINEIEINHSPRWKKKLIKKIEQNYSKAPLFKQCFPMILESIDCQESNLAKYLANGIRNISQYLLIETIIVPSSEVYYNTHLKGTARVIDICKKENTKVYVNAIGGVQLYDKEYFSNEGLSLNFLKPTLATYPQLGSDFIPGLSIIDILMFNSKEKVKEMLNTFELV